MTEPKPYFLFTRTPLHIGAGQSVGYVDLPIQREPHTRIPIVPGSSFKGVLRDRFPGDDELSKETRRWLFGHDTDEKEQSKFQAGALLIGEARVLCFPVRSAKGSFAWITCPLALARYERDAKPKLQNQPLPTTFNGLTETPENGSVTVLAGSEVTLDGDQVVLEEYTFTTSTDTTLKEKLNNWENHLKDLAGLKDDPVWKLLPGRLVIVPDGIFSFYVQSACAIAQHVAINDETGTAQDKALFNQENCPAETLFYGVITEEHMQNLEQIRGSNALSAATRVNRKAVTKLPAMIVNNGLLAAAAFAKDKSEELLGAMDAVALHLADRRIGRLPETSGTTDGLLKHLVAPNAGSDRLRLATSEALAYLSYLKRFANRGD